MTDMPLTRTAASEERRAEICAAVRKAENLSDIARLASGKDVNPLTAFLADPKISGSIYTLPREINHNTVAAFIDRHLDERERGKGLLMVSTDANGMIDAYHDIQFWPQWAACELGGAIRRDRQNRGQGSADAMTAFNWLFDVIGVHLICETAALDNFRTARLLERIGFAYKGQIKSRLPGGGFRPSRYWELSKADWLKRKQRGRGYS